MKNDRGMISIAVLLALVLAGALVLWVPNNPVGNALGVTQKQNKIVQTDVVTLIKDDKGVPIAYREVTSDKDIQQHVTFWEWLKSLPIIVVILMALGVACPAVGLFLHNLWSKAVADYKDLTGETKRIVVSVKLGLATIQDSAVKQKFLDALSAQQDSSTKDLVKDLLKGS